MIVEHEIIEQIENEPHGRSLAWCSRLAGRLGAREPRVTLRAMWRAGYLELREADGFVMQPWQVEQVWRVGELRDDIAVHATELGSTWAHA